MDDWKAWFAREERSATPQQKAQIKEARRIGISDLETAYAIYEWACPSFKEIWKTRPGGAAKMEQGEAIIFLYKWITGINPDGSRKIEGPEKGDILFKVLQRSLAEGMKLKHVTMISEKKSEMDVATNAIREAFRKNPKFTGDGKYVPTNRGIRSNPQLKTLAQLKTQFRGKIRETTEIEKYIQKLRESETSQAVLSLIEEFSKMVQSLKGSKKS